MQRRQAGLRWRGTWVVIQFGERQECRLVHGYDAIAVALLANSNPLGVIASSAFFGALQAGANRMQQTVNIETSLVFVIQALTVIFVIAAPTLGRFAFRRRGATPAPVTEGREEAAHAA